MHRQKGCGRIILWTLAAAAILVMPARGQASEEITLGSRMPMAGESVSDVQGEQATLSGLEGERATVVIFWSNQCPWVARYEDRFVALVEEFSGQGVSFVLVNSNESDAHPREAASESAARYREAGYPAAVTYLDDPSSRLANAFGAQRTPHVYVFDANSSLAYVGTIDDSPGDPANVGEQYLRTALESVVGGANVAVPQTKAFGCTIKFKS